MKTIVVVENDSGVRDLLTELLDIEDIRLVMLCGEDGAVPAIREAEPDACILDMMLDSISGIEIANELREEGLDSLPMIAITGSPYLAEVAEESGLFQGVFVKPFDTDELLTCLVSLLSL